MNINNGDDMWVEIVRATPPVYQSSAMPMGQLSMMQQQLDGTYKQVTIINLTQLIREEVKKAIVGPWHP